MDPRIEALPNGQWVIRDDTHLSVWAKQHGTIACDPALFRVIGEWIEGESVRVVWDIGACIGDHTRFYLDKGKQVVAVEPNPLAFECLTHNCPDATCLNIAASDASGKVRFATLPNVGESRITPAGDREVVAMALDSLDLPPPQFVKLDVEGWEVNALEGMVKTLRTHRPKCLVEINQKALAANGLRRHDITWFFHNLGYGMPVIVQDNVGADDPQYDVLFLP